MTFTEALSACPIGGFVRTPYCSRCVVEKMSVYSFKFYWSETLSEDAALEMNIKKNHVPDWQVVGK